MVCEDVCGQYTDLCPPATIAAWWVVAQRRYITDYTASGVHTRPGNGGFFHSCYLGSYINSDFGSTDQVKLPRAFNGIWNQIAIKGQTMQQAVSSWWHLPPPTGSGDDAAAVATGPWLVDVPWNPQGQPPPLLASFSTLGSGGDDDDAANSRLAASSRWNASAGKTPVVPWCEYRTQLVAIHSSPYSCTHWIYTGGGARRYEQVHDKPNVPRLPVVLACL